MSFANDLLKQAEHLVDWDGANPKQASLRRLCRLHTTPCSTS